MKDLKQLFGVAVIGVVGAVLFNFDSLCSQAFKADMEISRKLAVNPFPNARLNTEQERRDGMEARKANLTWLRNPR